MQREITDRKKTKPISRVLVPKASLHPPSIYSFRKSLSLSKPNEKLLLVLLNTDKLLEQTKTELQETLKKKFKKSKERFTFNFPLVSEEEKWNLRVHFLKVCRFTFGNQRRTEGFKKPVLVIMMIILEITKQKK